VTVDLPGGAGQQLVGMAPDVVPGQTVKVKVPNPAYKPKGRGGTAPAPPPPPSGPPTQVWAFPLELLASISCLISPFLLHSLLLLFLQEWVASTDPQSGRLFYLNTRTKETSWEKPAGFIPPPPPPQSPQRRAPAAPPGKQEVTFQVPPSWRPGQTINVRKPDGTTAQVAVAPGVKPGQTVRVTV